MEKYDGPHKSGIYLWCEKWHQRQDIILCKYKDCRRMKKCEEYQTMKRRIVHEIECLEGEIKRDELTS